MKKIEPLTTKDKYNPDALWNKFGEIIHALNEMREENETRTTNTNPSFKFLNNPEEDIYTLKDGKPPERTLEDEISINRLGGSCGIDRKDEHVYDLSPKELATLARQYYERRFDKLCEEGSFIYKSRSDLRQILFEGEG